jgi:chemotaxis protein histidine kinase CheA
MLADDPDLLAAFLAESRESLDGLEAQIIALDGQPQLRAAVDAIFRPVHTFKGNAPFFGYLEVKRLAHALETVLDHLRQGRMGLARPVTDALLAGLDGLRESVASLSTGGPEIVDPGRFAALVARLATVGPDSAGTDPWERVFADLTQLETQDLAPGPALDSLQRLRRGLTALRQARPGQPATGEMAAIRLRLATPLAAPLPAAEAAAIVAGLERLRAGLRACKEIIFTTHRIVTC